MRCMPEEPGGMISYELDPSGQRLVFSQQPIARFTASRQLGRGDREAGGQLFARADGKDIRVVEATGLRPSDRRSRFSFRPDRKAEQVEIADRHSKGFHFVGDWHTHPEDIPTPSPQDVQSLAEMFRRSTHRLNGMLMVIVGRRSAPEGLFVGLGDHQSLTILRSLQLEDDDVAWRNPRPVPSPARPESGNKVS